MHFSTLIFTTLISLGLAQDLTGLPDCAVTCFDDNFANSSCADTDVACLCADTTFFSDVEVCVLEACDDADVSTTLTWATAECDAVGVPLSKKRSVFGRKH
ncbi:uncharacterized protein PAC_14206 [Phialocephala subalpina]|uniref:CFEM domain-containing protein n=1 Tax=Phialocephala subalpina TaxID=576137 RepID=A0A1L7XH21_9HELO|nr:uncharacterized protein PAC_14206 [Phialocephala subalpina]